MNSPNTPTKSAQISNILLGGASVLVSLAIAIGICLLILWLYHVLFLVPTLEDIVLKTEQAEHMANSANKKLNKAKQEMEKMAEEHKMELAKLTDQNKKPPGPKPITYGKDAGDLVQETGMGFEDALQGSLHGY